MQVDELERGQHADTLMILCPACRSDRGETLGVVGPDAESTRATVIMQCKDCATVYLSPAPSVAGVENDMSNAVSSAYESPIRRLKAEVPSNTRFLYVSKQGVFLAAKHSPVEKFDQILAPLSLESAEDPGALIEQLAELLTENGRVEIVVGNVSSSTFGFFGGRHWWAYRYPHTRQHCSLKGIGILAGKHGLEVADSRSLRAADAWRISIRNWLMDWGAPRSVTAVFTGPWFLPWLLAWCMEEIAGLRGKASVLVVRLVKT